MCYGSPYGMVDEMGSWVQGLLLLTAHTMYPPSLWELTKLFPDRSQTKLSSCCKSDSPTQYTASKKDQRWWKEVKRFELNHLDILTSSTDDLKMEFKGVFMNRVQTWSLWKSTVQLFDIYRDFKTLMSMFLFQFNVFQPQPQRVLKTIWETSNKLTHKPTCFPRKRLSTCRLLRSQSTTRPLL